MDYIVGSRTAWTRVRLHLGKKKVIMSIMSSVFMLFDYPLEFGKMSHSSKIPNLQ